MDVAHKTAKPLAVGSNRLLQTAILWVGLTTVVGTAFGGAQSAPSSSTIPVRAVTLFSSGVGYFEHGGTVKGDSHAELNFKTDQINDVLKSLVLEDLDGGTVGTVVYPSQDPLEKILRGFQVDISTNPSLGELLSQLRGAQVKGQVSGEQFQGIILGLEKKKQLVGDKGQVVEVWAMNLLNGPALRSVVLNDLQRLEFEDRQVQEELGKALAAVAEARDQAKKIVTIGFIGTGERRVRFGYVLETPVWKTSYRLILSEKEKARIQGWAIVENQTDSDWSNVRLSLVSGRPISFIQPLYRPLYVPRPVVQPELYGSLQPQTYEAGTTAEEPSASQERERPGASKEMQAIARRKGSESLESKLAAAAPPASAPSAGVTSAAVAAVPVGDLFQYHVEHVSLPQQRSAMISIVVSQLDAERVSIYNAVVLPKHPLSAARLINTTGLHLLQGPVTVFEGHAYAGDARIDTIPPGQDRWISYGIDQQVSVTSPSAKSTSMVQTGRIVKGVLYLSRRQQAVQDYVLDSKADRDKVIVIEHPIRAGWKLVDSPSPVETTGQHYRFKQTVQPRQPAKLQVKEEIVESESLMLLPADLGLVELYSRTGEIPREVREILTRAAIMKGAIIDQQRHIQEKQRELGEIRQEQERIRANLGATTKGTAYHDRLLKKLNDQENRIEQAQSETEQLRQALQQQQHELEKFLTNSSAGDR
jgi:hypothetical protein